MRSSASGRTPASTRRGEREALVERRGDDQLLHAATRRDPTADQGSAAASADPVCTSGSRRPARRRDLVETRAARPRPSSRPVRRGHLLLATEVVGQHPEEHPGRLGPPPLGFVIMPHEVEDAVEGAEEVELATVVDLGQRGRDAPPVEDAGLTDDGVRRCLQVQPPAPRPVLGGEQTVGERSAGRRSADRRCRPRRSSSPPSSSVVIGRIDERGSSTRSRRASGARTTIRRPSVVCTWSVRTKSTPARDRRDHPVQVTARQPVVAVEVGEVAPGRPVRVPGSGPKPARRDGRCAAPADPGSRDPKVAAMSPVASREPSSTTITSSASGSAS